jgi:2-furoate---CoA ligase
VTLAQLLDRAAQRRPEAVAVVDGARRLTYAELAVQAAALGRGLADLGIGRGDRVLIALKNRLDHVLAYWALQTIGGVAAPVSFRLAGGELRYVLEDSGARVALFEPDTAATMLEAADGWHGRLVFAGADAPGGARSLAELMAAGAAAPARAFPVAESDLSLLLYTSGTTGRPKGVPRTHRNHHAGALAHALQCGYEWGERTLGVMPLYHTMGIHSLTSVAAVNGCFVCQPDWSAAGALALIEAERLTALYLIPTLYHDLVHSPEFRPERAASVRKLAYAGAPMLAALTERCVKAFRPEVFVNHYGSTEIYTFSVHRDQRAKPGCAGRASVNARLRLDPPGEGEILCHMSSDEAFTGYWNRPDADAKAIRDCWYHTGDVGRLDEDGDLWVVGRVDDMVISGGENVHPVEVEDVLARAPGVLEVAVIGAADDRLGQRVVACVVAENGVTAEDLDGYCLASDTLARFKRPREYRFVSELPKSASGKILRRMLRDET